MRWIVPVFGWPKTNEATARCETKTTIGLRRGYDSVKPAVLQSSSDHSAESDAIGAGRGAGPNRRREWLRIGSRIGVEMGWSLSIKFRVY